MITLPKYAIEYISEPHSLDSRGYYNENSAVWFRIVFFEILLLLAVRTMSDLNLRYPICRGVLLLCSSFCILLISTTNSLGDQVGVRVRFGVGDREPGVWDGSVTVADGKLLGIDGWRFQQMDGVVDANSWKAQTRRAAARRTNNPKQANPNRNNSPVTDNGILLAIDDVKPTTRVAIKTKQGDFEFALSDLAMGRSIAALVNRIEIERTASTSPIALTPTDDDFPSLANGPNGLVALAYVSFTPGLDRDKRARAMTEAPEDFTYLKTPAGGDQVWLRHYRDGKWTEPIAVSEGNQDVYKCAVAIDGTGATWVVWSANRDGNFDIWARKYEREKGLEPVRLSSSTGTDNSPVAATDSVGKVWIAWQSARDNTLCIVSRHQLDNGWSEEFRVSPQRTSCWSPTIAASADKNGEIAIAWDTYEMGDYDIWLRRFDRSGKAREAQPVAETDEHQARPTLCYDLQGRLWCAWEASGATWGKNWGALVQGQGIPLYQDRHVDLRILDGEQWKVPAEDFRSSLPDLSRRAGMVASRVRVPEPEAETRKASEEAETEAKNGFNNLSRMTCDNQGRVWMLVRTRQPDFRAVLGTVWLEFATVYSGKDWTGPVLIPHSDNLLYNYPSAIAFQNGLLVVHSSDHRQDRHTQRAGGGNNELGDGGDPFINDLFSSHLSMPSELTTPLLVAAPKSLLTGRSVSESVVKERADIKRCREYRATVQGKSMQILRGEFHRHTEISGDGGGDGALEDMWRYAIDVAGMDWIGNGDHDNGAGREYPWWLTQKTTDVFHLPGKFDPMFTYERSVRYPEGHRNVVFPYRGVRTLPRLPISDRDDERSAPDTQMLYRYLHQFNGICASHTSATSMGTDWRDNDPEVEPFVEIYQGARQNYERPDAPRAPQASDSIGGWEPKGFVNLALKKGYRLAFESSSDHRSTHISYSLVYAEGVSRQAIFDGMKKRHVYAATENIVADFRCTDSTGVEHMLGDEFNTAKAPELRVKLVGTAPFKKVLIVKDDEYVKVISPGKEEVELSWTDPAPTIGKASYYYVRGEQADGELVWVSPMWITVTGP